MTRITIAGTPIEMPQSATSPNWAPAMTEFFLAVESALNSAVGPYDLPAQIFSIDAYTSLNIFYDIENLIFPTETVLASFIEYAVKRNTDTNEIVEAGTLMVVYNEERGAGLKWEMARNFVGDAKIDFQITDIGQIQFAITESVVGASYTGQISFRAKSLQKA